MAAFIHGLGRVFSFGLLHAPLPAHASPECALARAFAQLDEAMDR